MADIPTEALQAAASEGFAANPAAQAYALGYAAGVAEGRRQAAADLRAKAVAEWAARIAEGTQQ